MELMEEHSIFQVLAVRPRYREEARGDRVRTLSGKTPACAGGAAACRSGELFGPVKVPRRTRSTDHCREPYVGRETDGAE